jgi:ATP-dependent Clp protease ATP-binding subunit ClpA
VFTRFSPAAKRVLRAAEQACRNYNHYYVGVEHVLLALLEEHDAEVDRRLLKAGVETADVYGQLRHALKTGEDRLWEGILVTPRARNVFALAAGAAGQDEVEPVHLLDAIMEEGSGLAAEILIRAGNLRDPGRVAG